MSSEKCHTCGSTKLLGSASSIRSYHRLSSISVLSTIVAVLDVSTPLSAKLGKLNAYPTAGCFKAHREFVLHHPTMEPCEVTTRGVKRI